MRFVTFGCPVKPHLVNSGYQRARFTFGLHGIKRVFLHPEKTHGIIALKPCYFGTHTEYSV